MVQGRAKAAGYHSAANVKTTNKYIENKVNAEMANLAAAFEAVMDNRALNDSATVSQAGGNDMAATVANNLTQGHQRPPREGREYATNPTNQCTQA